MTEGTKISNFPLLTSFDGTEELAAARGGANYRIEGPTYAAWILESLGYNRPPTAVDQIENAFDTANFLPFNLLTGAADADGDAISVQAVTYGGTNVPVGAAFQAVYGVFFVSGNGDGGYTLGPAARALTTGDVEHEIFAYTVADGRGGIATKHLTITITGTNSAPIVSYVNGQTPMNQVLFLNLLYRLAFDPESTVTIGSFTIAGVAGTKAVNSDVPIPGVGTIHIASGGDCTFTPLAGFVGPGPTITYVVTDGVNNVNGFLTLAVNPSIAGTQPIVLFTDTVSGPLDDGGQAAGGAFLHIHGVRFGDPSGLGTTTKVYIGGVEVGAYIVMDVDPYARPGFGRQRIAVRIGALGGATLGLPLHVKVVVSGQDSNTDSVFTPNPGRIFYVSKSGNDSTGVIGDPTHPFRLLQTIDRLGGVYALMRAGDQAIVRGDGGAEWTDTAFSTAWLRFRDAAQQGSNPTGAPGTGWIWFMGYPGEVVQYRTTAGNKGGFQGPGQDVTGTTGDFVGFSNFRIKVDGGATRDAGPVNMQYNAQNCRVVGCELGPWVAGDSDTLNCAGVSGQGNFFKVLGCHIHSIEGTSALQNHGVYPGTNSYGWEIAYNWIHDISGGSHLSFNDSDGGTGTFETPFGIWTGFTNITIHHNWMENAAKYSISFNDIGANQGELDARIWCNVIIGTGLPPLHFGTTTSTSDVTFAFNTVYNCNTTASGGNAMFRNDGLQQASSHSIKLYDNIFAFGPSTVHGTGWMNDTTGFSDGVHWSRNLYFVNGDTSAPAPSTVDAMAVVGDPKFANVGTGDFTPLVSSPAVNAATQALPAGMLVPDDYTCQGSRLLGGAADIGAFEYLTPTPYVITPPTATGGPQVGVTSSVPVGAWGNSPTSYSRQFRLDGTPAGSPISGTGSATYSPVAGDERKTLYCDVTATNGAGSVVYTVVVGVVAVGAGAPVNTALPVITGTTQVGQVLAASTGTWSPDLGTYTYQWLRGSTPISGATSSTYTQVSGDLAAMIDVLVFAVDPVNGSPVALAAAVGPVAPAPADPQVAQHLSHALLSNTNVDFVFPSDINNGSLALAFMGEWDQRPANGHYSDSQGHTSSNVTLTTDSSAGGSNPWVGWAFFKSTALGAYTLTINMDSSAGGGAVALEVTGLDPTTVQDIPSDAAFGTGTAVALSGSTANTKATDLVLVGVSVAGTGHTVTADAGWDPVDNVDGTSNGVFVFKRKESAIETFAFAATIDASTTWNARSFVVKGT
jgi:VCBS repeat-containing protein